VRIVTFATGGTIYAAVTDAAFVEQQRTVWYEITDICSGLLLLCQCHVASFLLLDTVLVQLSYYSCSVNRALSPLIVLCSPPSKQSLMGRNVNTQSSPM